MPATERNLEPIKLKVEEALVKLSEDPRSGLTVDKREAAASRLLAIEERTHDVLIHIASDELSLDHKIVIESKILKDLAKVGDIDSQITLNFRKTKQAAISGAQAVKPQPVVNRASPFGLKIDKRAIPGVREVIVVASGKGGVGKSTVSVNLAVALARMGKRVGLLDADIYGPSAPLMLNVKGPLDVSADQKIIPKENFGLKCVSFGFLSDAYNPVIWRGPLVAKTIEQFSFQVEWGQLDYLVVDLPPGTGDVQISLIENIPLHGAVIVSSPQDVALIDAHKALTMFEKLDVPVLGLVENMSTHICSNCGHEDPIFGEEGAAEFSQQRQLDLLAKIPLHRSIRLAGDGGQPIASLADHPVAETFLKLAEAVSSQ